MFTVYTFTTQTKYYKCTMPILYNYNTNRPAAYKNKHQPIAPMPLTFLDASNVHNRNRNTYHRYSEDLPVPLIVAENVHIYYCVLLLVK